MKEVKNTALGKDGVRMIYVNLSCSEIKNRVVRIVLRMFESRADRWEDSLKCGQIVPLHKKGNRNDANNYRGICLLPTGQPHPGPCDGSNDCETGARTSECWTKTNAVLDPTGRPLMRAKLSPEYMKTSPTSLRGSPKKRPGRNSPWSTVQKTASWI